MLSLVKPFETSNSLSLGQGWVVTKPFKILTPIPVCWSFPPFGRFKINVDCSLITSSDLAGGSGLLMDSTGHVVVGFASYIGHKSIMVAEILALIQGVKLCIDQGYLDALIESYSQVLCHMISSDRSYSWHLDALIR
ncbi:hypothetical protein ACH5RR_037221 [Cinchona calisaya]|uniref:RNase H type-1 domain-containing protein n=1 Tax=Cinchona calisaya TaxID=153742 RepID=A0ABD2YA77_9GENT